MKYILYIALLLLTVIVFGQENPENHTLEISYIRGIEAYENKYCSDEIVEKDGEKYLQIGAVSYFNKFIKSGGDENKVIKFLAFCEVSIGVKSKNKDTLNNGLSLLEKIYISNRKDIEKAKLCKKGKKSDCEIVKKDNEVLKLIYSLYISLERYKEANKYTPEILKLAEKEKELYLVVSRLYFQTKEFKKLLTIIDKYPKDKNKKEEYIEILTMKSFSLFELKKYKEAKVIFVELKTIKIKNKNLEKAIDDRLNFINSGIKRTYFDLIIHNGIVFDSNITSKPSLTQQYEGLNPLIPDVENSSFTGMGVRNETYLGMLYYPLNTDLNTITLGTSLFTGIHFPYKIDDFNPSDYDLLSLSLFTEYRYHNNYTKDKFFIYSINLMGNTIFSNIINNIINYNNSLSLLNMVSFSTSTFSYNNLGIDFRIKRYNSFYAKPELNSQNGTELALFLTQGFLFSNSDLNFTFGYLRDDSEGELFKNNGFSFKGDFTTQLSIIKFNLSSYYDYRSYPIYETSEHIDKEFSIAGNVLLQASKHFNFGLKYRYIKSDSTLKQFTFSKHIGGLYFNLIF